MSSQHLTVYLIIIINQGDFAVVTKHSAFNNVCSNTLLEFWVTFWTKILTIYGTNLNIANIPFKIFKILVS